MAELKFTVMGEPCAQGRPRFSTLGGYVKAIDPAKSRNQKSYIKYLATTAAKQQGWVYTYLPIHVEIIAYMGIQRASQKNGVQRQYVGRSGQQKSRTLIIYLNL